jgi:two-component system LytT family sensor kinase
VGRRLATGTLVVGGAVLLLALIETSRYYITNAVANTPQPWVRLFVNTLPPWVILAALAPIPLMIARRHPIGREGVGRAAAVHLLFALVFSAMHIGAMALYTFMYAAPPAPFASLLMKFSSLLAVDVMIYAAIVGVAHALRFSREARERELAASQLQASLTEARLAALRRQLNPHFLFNTLNAISTMALKGEQEEVVKTLGYLGELLRVALDERLPQEVTLAEELEFLDRYLEIQRTRLGDRLEVQRDIAEDTPGAMVPSMLLQPLVENAVTHGVARVPGVGRICISANRRGGELVLEVLDSGPGFRADGEHVMPDRLVMPTSGIGLSNTRARLSQLYGANQSFVIDSGISVGARVTVSIPYRLEESASPR